MSERGPLKLYYSPSLNIYFFKMSYGKRYCDDLVDVSKKFRFWVDPRPVISRDLEILSSACCSVFGSDVAYLFERICRDCLTIVNVGNDPVLDHVYEFMVNGELLCTVNYDLKTLSFNIVPGKLGAALLYSRDACNIVISDERLRSFSGYRVSIGNCRYFVAVTRDGRLCGVALRTEKGFVPIKIWSPAYPEEVLSSLDRVRRTYRELYEFNREYIEFLVEKVRRAVKWLECEEGRRGVVGFSGGKDSLLTLHLLEEVNSDPLVIYVHIPYADTEVTRDFVYRVCSRLGFSLEVVEYSLDRLLNYLEILGIPVRGFRWCTPLWKLAPMFKLIKERYSLDKIVSYTGSRRYETFRRSIRPPTYIDSEAGVLSHCIPYNFPKLLEYLYLWYRARTILHPDYYRGFERISCVMCPHRTCLELKMSEMYYGELMNFWKKYMEKIIDVMFFTEKERKIARSRHLWRFFLLHRELQRVTKILSIRYVYPTMSLEELNPFLRTVQRSGKVLTLSIPVRRWNSYSLEVNLRSILKLLVDGRVNEVHFISDEVQGMVNSRGYVVISYRCLDAALNVLKVLVMTMNCGECGHCHLNCDHEAIEMPFTVVPSKCVGCLKCLLVCPIARYYVDMLIYSKLTSLREAKGRMIRLKQLYAEYIKKRDVAPSHTPTH